MNQKLKTILKTEKGEPKVGQDGDIRDCFDSDTVLQTKSVKGSGESVKGKGEVTLTRKFALTKAAKKVEQLKINRKEVMPDPFNSSMSHGVL